MYIVLPVRAHLLHLVPPEHKHYAPLQSQQKCVPPNLWESTPHASVTSSTKRLARTASRSSSGPKGRTEEGGTKQEKYSLADRSISAIKDGVQRCARPSSAAAPPVVVVAPHAPLRRGPVLAFLLMFHHVRS